MPAAAKASYSAKLEASKPHNTAIMLRIALWSDLDAFKHYHTATLCIICCSTLLRTSCILMHSTIVAVPSKVMSCICMVLHCSALQCRGGRGLAGWWVGQRGNWLHSDYNHGPASGTSLGPGNYAASAAAYVGKTMHTDPFA